MNKQEISGAFDTSASILQKVDFPLFNERSINFFVKRDDLIDPLVSGNKWRKLKYNLEHAFSLKKDTIITFGGAFSNHLLATAKACNQSGFKSVGIVRGEELNPESNDNLKMCADLGMKLIFVSRDEYVLRADKMYQEDLMMQHENSVVIPEGGANYYGIIGCQEILNETPNNFEHVFVAAGTTTTTLGLAFSKSEKTQLHVVPVLKGFDTMLSLKELLQYSGFNEDFYNEIIDEIVVHENAHFGGYAKYNEELLDKMEEFYQATGLPLDPVYTGKLLFEILDWIVRENIHNTSILFIHTGGIKNGETIAQKENRKFA